MVDDGKDILSVRLRQGQGTLQYPGTLKQVGGWSNCRGCWFWSLVSSQGSREAEGDGRFLRLLGALGSDGELGSRQHGL